MIKLFTNYLLWGIIAFMFLPESFAADVPCDAATTQTNFVSPDCINCSVINPSNSVDNITGTSAILFLDPSIHSGFIEQFLGFSNAGNSNDSVRIVLSFPTSESRSLSLNNVFISTYNGRNYNRDRKAITSPGVSLKFGRVNPDLPSLLQFVTVTFAPSGTFTRVGIRIVGSEAVSNNPASVHIYYAYKFIDSPTVSDVSVCPGGSATLQATGPAGATFRWYSQSTGGLILHTGKSYNINFVTTNKTYYVESFKNGCANTQRSEVHLTLKPLPAIPALTDVTICRGSSALLVANGSPGSTFNWFTSASGGISVHQGATYTTPALFSNVTYYVEASDGCVNHSRGVAHVEVQTNKGLAKQWNRVLGGSQNDVLYDGVATTDGGYLLTGWAGSDNGDISDITNTGGSWIIKTDANGNRLWDKILEPNGGSLVKVLAIPDGFLVGQSGADFILYKLDNSGNIIWKKTYGNGGEGIAAIVPTTDGGYVLGGNTSSNAGGDVTTGTHGFTDFWIVKIDADGNKIWDNTFGGSLQEKLGAIVPTLEGGFLLGGITRSDDGDVTGYQGDADLWLVKVNGSGNKIWAKTFGGSWGEYMDIRLGLTPASDGNYVVALGSQSIDGDVTDPVFGVGNSEGWLLKINPSGTKIWDKNFAVGGDGALNSIVPASDGGFVLGGYVQVDEPDFWVVRTDALGNELWHNNYGGTHDDELATIIPGNSNSFLAIGYASSEDGDVHPGQTQLPVEDWTVYNGWILKFDIFNCPGIPLIGAKLSDTSLEPVEQNAAFPNPFSDHINLRVYAQSEEPITIEVFNSSGIKIYSSLENPGQQEFTLSTSGFASGVYVFKVNVGGTIYTRKAVRN